MRQLTLTTILFLFVCIGTLSLQAQVTIDRSDFPMEASFTETSYFDSESPLSIPSEGANQVWDYSFLQGTPSEIVYHDATNEEAFPNALNHHLAFTTFQQFNIVGDNYRGLDDDGLYGIGIRVKDRSYSITAISGGADDILRFPPRDALFDKRHNEVQLPMTYQDKWATERKYETHFELSVAAFGLNQTPGVNRQTSIDTYEVVGYGTLIIPLEDGSSSTPIEGLMVKESKTFVDSIFLGGAPAPTVLLDAFGITQGGTSNRTSYAFYTPGFSSKVLTINSSGRYSYMPAAAQQPEPSFTLNREDFPRKAGFSDFHIKASVENFTLPSEGANQEWDYTNISTIEEITTEYTDETNNPDFPNALNSFERGTTFLGFPMPTRSFETVDEEGWAFIGKTTTDVTYPIANLTGGADDVLRFPESSTLFDERINRIKFPLTDLSKWTESSSEVLDYELTVGGFGLNQTPGTINRIHTHTHEAVGYGTLRIPTAEGTPSEPLEVVLLKVVESAIDSFYLGGALAPEALTSVFGLTQGVSILKTFTYYVFYTPDFGTHVMRINVNKETGMTAESVFYRPGAAKQPEPNFILNREDFTREAGFTDIAIQAALESATLPTEGANQVWDYTALSAEETIIKEYTDASNHPDFPNALNILPDNGQTFQGLPIPTNFVETVDEEGWGYIGKVVTDITHSISALTGGADDALRFVGGNSLYDGRINRIQFPLTDLSEWTESRTELIDFELTVGAFGLNQVPGYIERTHTHTHEAMGYGTLQIPLEDGTPSEPMEVVLLKVEETSIDYYYLGGALAPEALTSAFGITQGTQLLVPKTYYTFYTPDFHINVMRFNVNPTTGEMANVFYRPQAGKAQVTPIAINHNRVCDVPSVGQSQVTVVITGGVGPYQVSGNFNGEIEENESFIFIMNDNETTYEISVVDAEGNESLVLENVLPCTKLPVELLNFEGKTRNDGNLLQWTTASELNNHFFTLSYSTTGQNFIPIQRITGNGTTSSANSYEFLHEDAPSGFVYYQLSQTDLDGTNKDLKVISLNRKEFGISSIEVSPVPTKSQLNVSFDFVNTSNAATLNIYDSMGRIVKSQTLSDTATSIQLDVNNLPEGTYFLQLNNGLEALASKFVKY